MKKIQIFLLGLIYGVHALCWGFSCNDPQPIFQKPIIFDKERKLLTQNYQLSHYGLDTLLIEPKLIILHWTVIPNFNASFRTFNQPTLPLNSPRRSKLPGDLNVSAHFLVDKNGAIYQLMPETWMARHVIGLNHYAIGIENVGGIDGKDDLTAEQIKANAYLVCYLKNKYPEISEVIGHNEYQKFKNTPLWLERDPNYFYDKTDPGPDFVRSVMRLVNNNKDLD